MIDPLPMLSGVACIAILLALLLSLGIITVYVLNRSLLEKEQRK
jgi:hypothetical protein